MIIMLPGASTKRAFINDNLAILRHWLVAAGIRCRVWLGNVYSRHSQIHGHVGRISVHIRGLDYQTGVGLGAFRQIEGVLAICALDQNNLTAGVCACAKGVDIRSDIVAIGILPSKSGVRVLHEHFNLVAGSCVRPHIYCDCRWRAVEGKLRHIIMHIDHNLAKGIITSFVSHADVDCGLDVFIGIAGLIVMQTVGVKIIIIGDLPLAIALGHSLEVVELNLIG